MITIGLLNFVFFAVHRYLENLNYGSQIPRITADYYFILYLQKTARIIRNDNNILHRKNNIISGLSGTHTRSRVPWRETEHGFHLRQSIVRDKTCHRAKIDNSIKCVFCTRKNVECIFTTVSRA